MSTSRAPHDPSDHPSGAKSRRVTDPDSWLGDEAEMALVDWFGDAADQLDVALRTLLERYLEVRDWGGMPGATGLPAASWLRLVKRLPRWLVGQVEDIAGRLPAIPAVAGCFFDGVITFEQLADFVRTTAPVNGPPLARLDVEAADLAAVHRQQHLPPADWCTDVTAWVQDLRAPGWAQRQARRTERDGSRVTIQQDPAISLSARR